MTRKEVTNKEVTNNLLLLLETLKSGSPTDREITNLVGSAAFKAEATRAEVNGLLERVFLLLNETHRSASTLRAANKTYRHEGLSALVDLLSEVGQEAEEALKIASSSVSHL